MPSEAQLPWVSVACANSLCPWLRTNCTRGVACANCPRHLTLPRILVCTIRAWAVACPPFPHVPVVLLRAMWQALVWQGQPPDNLQRANQLPTTLHAFACVHLWRSCAQGGVHADAPARWRADRHAIACFAGGGGSQQHTCCGREDVHVLGRIDSLRGGLNGGRAMLLAGDCGTWGEGSALPQGGKRRSSRPTGNGGRCNKALRHRRLTVNETSMNTLNAQGGAGCGGQNTPGYNLPTQGVSNYGSTGA
eukprot:6255747-Lingulodinium_polyedra.AAC.2